MKVSNVCFCFRAHWWCHITASSAEDWWCCITVEAQADDVNVWCHCTGWLTCFFSLSVCLLQQWETFSERSSSSQTLTQFDSNIAPADPVSQSLSMHGFTINEQTLTLSGSLFLSLSLSVALSAWCSFKVQSVASAVVSMCCDLAGLSSIEHHHHRHFFYSNIHQSIVHLLIVTDTFIHLWSVL